MQAAIVFCSHNINKEFYDQISGRCSPDSTQSDSMRALKDACLQFENVLPIGCDPAQLLIFSKKFGFKLDLYKKLFPSAEHIETYSLLKLLHKSLFYELMAPAWSTLNLRLTDWRHGWIEFDPDFLKSLDVSDLNDVEKFMLDASLSSSKLLSYGAVDNSYLNSMAFCMNPKMNKNNYRSIITDNARKIGITLITPVVNPWALESEQYSHEEVSSFRMEDIPVVDVDKISWDQIFEFRSDNESFKSARRFRNYHKANLEGLSKSYAYDKFMQDYDDYLKSIKKHGMESKIACLEQLASSKTILVSAGLTIASLAIGEPVVATSAICGGVFIEGAKISLKLSKRSLSLQQLKSSSPMLYVDKLRSYEKA